MDFGYVDESQEHRRCFVLPAALIQSPWVPDRLCVCLSVRPSVCLSVCLSVCRSVCLSDCLRSGADEVKGWDLQDASTRGAPVIIAASFRSKKYWR